MSSKMPNQLFHFTNIEAALNIFREQRFNPSKVTNCSDVFEIDHSPFFVDLSNVKQFSWFCKQLLSFYEGRHPLFASLAGAKTLKNLPVSNRLNFLKNSLSKGMEKDKLYTSEKFNDDLIQQRDNLHVYCFSNCHPSNAVGAWANHANRHKGVALAFEFPKHEYGTRLHPVKYNGKNIRGALFSPREAIGMYTQMDDDNFRFKLFEKILLTKHTDLNWEREWRFISSVLGGDSQPSLKIHDGLVTAIYLGLNITEENKVAIVNLIKELNLKIKIFDASKDRRFLRINFHEIK